MLLGGERDCEGVSYTSACIEGGGFRRAEEEGKGKGSGMHI